MKIQVVGFTLKRNLWNRLKDLLNDSPKEFHFTLKIVDGYALIEDLGGAIIQTCLDGLCTGISSIKDWEIEEK